MDINTGAKHEKDLQGVRMTPAKWTSIQEQSTKKIFKELE
jgi:hypothetical protein